MKLIVATKTKETKMLLNEEIRQIANDVDEGQENSGFLIAFAHAIEKRVTEKLEAKNDVWKTQAQVAIENLTGQIWIWQGDGYDDLESMSNSMIVAIRADRLKELISRRPSSIVLSDGRKLVYKDLVYPGYGRMGWILQNEKGEDIRVLNQFESDFIESSLKAR